MAHLHEAEFQGHITQPTVPIDSCTQLFGFGRIEKFSKKLQPRRARIQPIVYPTNSTSGMWALKYGKGAEQRVETRAVQIVNATNRVEIDDIRYAGAGAPAYRAKETYTSFPWGMELVENRIDPDNDAGTDNDLVTTITFNTDTNADYSYSQIDTVIYPDGYWEKRVYQSDPEQVFYGTLEDILLPDLDSPSDPSGAAEDVCNIEHFPRNSDGLITGTDYYHHSKDYDTSIFKSISLVREPSSGVDSTLDGYALEHFGNDEHGFVGRKVLTANNTWEFGYCGHNFWEFNTDQPNKSFCFHSGTYNPTNHTFTGVSTEITNGPDYRESVIYSSQPWPYLDHQDGISMATVSVEGESLTGDFIFTNRSWRESYIYHNGSVVQKEMSVFIGINSTNEALFDLVGTWIYQNDSLGHVTNITWLDATSGVSRVTYSADTMGMNLRTTTYGVNELNQYTNVVTPSYKDVIGVALATNSVTVNSDAADRKVEYFHREIATTNSGNAVWQNVSVSSGGSTTNRGLVLPKSSQTLTYDADGNLSSDGVWNYQWDAENRLVAMAMTNVTGIANSNRLRLDFAYDCIGRRVQKTVSTWNGSAFANSKTNRFVSDYWNLIAVIDPSSTVLQSFVWGNDLSGTMTKAGGVGGLLMVTISGANNFTCYDGNGNITALIDGVSGRSDARYDYNPFGELIRTTGLLARLNPFRFSTKFWDDESGLLYYGFRFYSPSSGKWIGREPSHDQVFLNLYLFCGNNSIGRFDLDGQFWDELWSFTKSVGAVLTGTISGAFTGWVASGFNPAGAIAGAIAGTANGLLALLTGSMNGDSWAEIYGKSMITGALSGIPGGMAMLGSGWVTVGLGALGGSIAGMANALIYGSHGGSILRSAIIGALLGGGAGVAGEADDAILDGVLAFASETGGNTINGYMDLLK